MTTNFYNEPDEIIGKIKRLRTLKERETVLIGEINKVIEKYKYLTPIFYHNPDQSSPATNPFPLSFTQPGDAQVQKVLDDNTSYLKSAGYDPSLYLFVHAADWFMPTMAHKIYFDVPKEWYPEYPPPRIFESSLNFLHQMHRNMNLPLSIFQKGYTEESMYVFPFKSDFRIASYVDQKVRLSKEMGDILREFLLKNKHNIQPGSSSSVVELAGLRGVPFNNDPACFFMSTVKILIMNRSSNPLLYITNIDTMTGMKITFIKFNIVLNSIAVPMYVAKGSETADRVLKLIAN